MTEFRCKGLLLIKYIDDPTIHTYLVDIYYDIDFIGRKRSIASLETHDAKTNVSSKITINNSSGIMHRDALYESLWYPANDLLKLLNTGNVSIGEITTVDEVTGHCQCSNCAAYINPFDKYCKDCGRRIIALTTKN